MTNPIPSQKSKPNYPGLLRVPCDVPDLPVLYRVHTGDPAPSAFPRQYTIEGNTNHGDIEILRTFHNTLKNFVKAGGTDVVIESDGVYQKIFDRVKAGQAKLSDFSDVMDVSGYVSADKRKEAQGLFQDVMKIALDNKIKFHAYDRDPAIIKQQPDLWAEVFGANTSAAGMAAIKEKMKDPAYMEKLTKFTDEFNRERREMDLKVVENVQGFGPNAKVLLFYGADHLFPLAKGLGLSNSQGVIVTAPGSAADKSYADQKITLVDPAATGKNCVPNSKLAPKHP